MQTPSSYPDVPVQVAREVLEGEGVSVEEGPLGDWWLEKGDVGIPMCIGPGLMPAQTLHFLCRHFLLDMCDVYVKIQRVAANRAPAPKSS